MERLHWRINIEPEERHRFRTLKEGNHGMIKGDGDSYPSVVLEINSPEADTFHIENIKVYCYATASNETEQDLLLSPHTLQKKGIKSNSSFHLIEAEENTPQVYKFTVRDYWVGKCNQRDIQSVLYKKYEEYGKMGITQKLQEMSKHIIINKNKDRDEKSNKRRTDSVYLAFSMFNELTKQWKTVFSKKILNLDPIWINHLCNPRVPMTSSENIDLPPIVLLVRDVDADYTLEVREFDQDTMNNKWLATVDSPKALSQNKALIYNLPTHPNPDNKQSVTCTIKLKHGRSESNEISIVYENPNHHMLIKRPAPTSNASGNSPKRPCYKTDTEKLLGGHQPKDYMYDSSPVHGLAKGIVETPHTPREYIKTDTEEDVRKKENLFKFLSQLEKDVNKRADTDEEQIWEAFKEADKGYTEAVGPTESTLFHDAIQFNDFYLVDRILAALEETLYQRIRERLGKWRDCRGRTLLHTVFVYDSFDFIRTLLDMCPDALLKQDQYGNTPLHIALQSREKDWIEELINNEDFYNVADPSTLKRMTRLLSIYNQANLTVLHSAIKRNCLPLVEMLLQHCQRSHIDACEIRVMGNGDSLMHLVANMNHDKDQENDILAMKKLILKYYPNADQIINYAGYNAYGNYYEAMSASESDDDSDHPTDEMSKLSLMNFDDYTPIITKTVNN